MSSDTDVAPDFLLHADCEWVVHECARMDMFPLQTLAILISPLVRTDKVEAPLYIVILIHGRLICKESWGCLHSLDFVKLFNLESLEQSEVLVYSQSF